MTDLEEVMLRLRESIDILEHPEYPGCCTEAAERIEDALGKLKNWDDWSITDKELLKCTDKELRVIVNALLREILHLLLQYECDRCGHRAEKIPKPCPSCGASTEVK